MEMQRIKLAIPLFKDRVAPHFGASSRILLVMAEGGTVRQEATWQLKGETAQQIAHRLIDLGVQGLPPYSTGYLNWLQWIILAGCSVPMAIVGARAAHRLPAKQLKYIFIGVMFYMGLKMIGDKCQDIGYPRLRVNYART